MQVDDELAAIATHAWRAFPDTYAQVRSRGKWKPYRHLRYLADVVHRAILGGDGRVIVSMPPRHGKSEFTSVWLPQWYLDMYPDRRVIGTSYGAELATGFARRVRDGLDIDARDVDDLSPLTSTADGSKAAHRFDTPDGGGMIAAGVGGPITGRGGDLLIVDDPIKNWEEAQSTTLRQKHKDWFNSTLYTRCEPGATIIVVMTRWHDDDLAGWLEREHADDWTVARLDAICESDEDVLGRSRGDALCPERYDVERLLKLKAAVTDEQGSRIWEALFQQRPVASGGNIFRREWFGNRYDAPPSEFDELWQSWDFTFGGKSSSSSYVVGQVWGRKGSRRYLLDQVRDRMSFPQMLQAMRDLSARWPGALRKLVEAKANGAAVADTLESEIDGIIRITPTTSKEERAEATTGLWEAGNVWLPMCAPWVGDFIQEHVSFPAGANDDQVDATSQALRHTISGSFNYDWL